jgi:hypothetical protein
MTIAVESSDGVTHFISCYGRGFHEGARTPSQRRDNRIMTGSNTAQPAANAIAAGHGLAN